MSHPFDKVLLLLVPTSGVESSLSMKNGGTLGTRVDSIPQHLVFIPWTQRISVRHPDQKCGQRVCMGDTKVFTE